MTGGNPLIDMRNVAVKRDTRTALHDVNLRIGSGEHVAILGPNGCGKSTLVKIITRECYPLARDGASISILGRDRWNVFELRSLLGIVSNDLMAACTRDAPGIEIVLSGFFSSIVLSPRDEVTPGMQDKAETALKRLGIAHLAGRPITAMSSGEARRVLLARALVHNPQALLLDEPSTALDLYAQHEMRETLRALALEGLTIVLVTHHLEDIIPEMERVILMRQGRIVADGRKQDVLTSGALSSLFGLPLSVAESDGYYRVWQHGGRDTVPPPSSVAVPEHPVPEPDDSRFPFVPELADSRGVEAE